MKPASAKSRILGRLVSVLLVPVVLSSSVTTVYVSADGEDTIEAQVTEPVQEPEVVEEKTEETQVIEEEVVEEVKEVEETKETEETVETKTSEVGTGDEVVEGTPKTAEEIEAEAQAKAEERAAALAALLERFGVASEEELAALAALTDEELTEKGYSSDDISALRSWFGGEQETEPEQPEEVIVEPSEEEITEGTEESEEQQELTKEEILEKLGISEEEFEELSAIVSIDELVAILQERGLSEEEIDLFLSLFDEEDLEAQLLGSELVAPLSIDTIKVKVIDNTSESVKETAGTSTYQTASISSHSQSGLGVLDDNVYEVGVEYGFGNPIVTMTLEAPEGYVIAVANFQGVNYEVGEKAETIQYTFSEDIDGDGIGDVDPNALYELSYQLAKKPDETVLENLDVKFANCPTHYNDEGGKVYYSTDREKLRVTLKGRYNNVESVKVEYAGGQSYMTPGSDGLYTWVPTEFGTYKVSQVIITVREQYGIFPWQYDTREITKVAERTLCYYSDDEARHLDVKANPDLDNKWFSAEVYKNGYTITVSGKTSRKISGVSASGNLKGTVDKNEYNSSDRKYHFKATFTIPASEDGSDDGTYLYEFKYLYAGDTTACSIDKKYTAKIDCTKPAIVSYDMEPAENEIFGVVKVSGAAETEKNSAIVRVEYKVQPRLVLGPVVIKHLWAISSGVDVNANTDEAEVKFSFGTIFADRLLDAFGAFDAVQYTYESIIVKDAAGNTKELNLKDQAPWVSWDGMNPTITYGFPDDDESRRENPYRYAFYDEDIIDSTVKIHDYSLKAEKTTVENVSGFSEMTIVPLNTESMTECKDGTEFTRITDQNYKVSTNGTGIYQLISYAEDTKGFWKLEPSEVVIVDKENPIIDVYYNNDKNTPAPFYNNIDSSGGVKIKVVVDEKFLNEESSKVTIYAADREGNKGAQIAELSGDSVWEGDFGVGPFVATYPIEEDGHYIVEVEAIDYAKRQAEPYRGKFFTLDRKVPDFKFEFDKSDAKNGKYFNATKTATITATDLTFDVNSVIDVTKKYGEPVINTWKQTGVDTYTATITFDQDGYYSFKITMQDEAKNPAVIVEEEEFVVDKTAPEIKVAYDFNEPRNGMYYRTARTANVDIEDISFDSDLVKVTSQPLADITELPQLGGFSSNEKQNYASMTFANDGTYGYIINCEDLAGNSASSYTSDVFVIDTTAPEVKFAGVENFSANNGTVAPSVTYVDKYMDMDATTVTMTGSNNGAVTLGSQIAPTENGFVVSYADFERVKSMDDLYTLNATVYDLAGNETKEQLVFSVNRFGSVFVLGDAAKALNEEYYTNEPKDVSITEINVDELTYKDVSISRDGDVKELKNGKQYQVSKQGSDTSWKTYTYTISKDNFKKDGVYSVTVYTKDRATNVQDNKSRDAEINFAVDQTAPSIVAAGLKSGETYKEASHTVNIDVTDNMGVTNLTVYKDGKEIGAYDADALETAGGVESITLTESDKKQTVTIVAEDVAGNVETVVYDNILVSTKEPVQIIDDPTPESPAPHNEDDRPIRVIVFVIIALVIVAAGAGAGITIYKKKAENQ